MREVASGAGFVDVLEFPLTVGRSYHQFPTHGPVTLRAKCAESENFCNRESQATGLIGARFWYQERSDDFDELFVFPNLH